ncbi:MAG: hypothetical protein QY332_07145 [Anaerolineales bacterium]|nr:MAG: hypothetical protein QY332_07145 [Anaerolineales bacterium]
MLISCSTMDAWLFTPTPVTPTETPPPTATINWFPATATSTLQTFPTKAPTAEMRPGLGNILLSDDFSDPSLWDTAVSNQASAGVDNNRLTLAVQSGVYMLSLRQDLALNNFYAEITARPSLCRSDDNYGVLIRATTATYYRFALACNGTVRAERISSGNRVPLQQPLQSGDVPPGAPGEVRIGIWAVGREMRLFLNGRFQFSVSDPTFRSGTIGVFVRSAGDTAAVVSFSDLSIQGIDYIPPTNTPVP